MKQTLARTRFAGMRRAAALGVLALLGVSIGCCIYASVQQPLTRPALNGQHGDVDFYKAVIARVHAGQNYYAATSSELRAGNYGMQSVFNWRTPQLAVLLAKLPTPTWGRSLLGALASIALIMIRIAARKETGAVMRIAIPFMAFLGGLIGAFAPDGLYFGEMWAGTLICISIFALAMGWWRAGVIAGILALFFRELALPYVLLAAGLALWKRRWPELWAWTAALTIFALFYIMHAISVRRWILPTDPADPTGWLQLGGLKYLLVISRWRGLAWTPPDWVMGIYFPLALLGLAGWRSELGTRIALTVALYLLLFAFIGKPYNDYWGMLINPLVGMGVVWGVVSLRDLITTPDSPPAANP